MITLWNKVVKPILYYWLFVKRLVLRVCSTKVQRCNVPPCILIFRFSLLAFILNLMVMEAEPSVVSASKVFQGKKKQTDKKNSGDKQSNKKKSGKSSSQESIKKKHKELEQLQQQIAKDKERLKKVQEKEKKVRGSLTEHKQKKKKIAVSLAIIAQRLQKTQDSLEVTNKYLQHLTNTIRSVQLQWSSLIRQRMRADYRVREEPDSLEIQQQIHDRIIQIVGIKIQKQLVAQAQISSSLSDKREYLSDFYGKQENLKKSEQHRFKKIESKIELSEKALDSIRSDKKLLLEVLADKNRSAKKIQEMIESLVKEQIQKQKGGASKKRQSTGKNDNDYTRLITSAGNSKKISLWKTHTLPWPVQSRKILHGFGEYHNPQTHTKMIHLGINIAAGFGSPVKSVAPGVVSMVSWLPGFGSLLIIDHGNDVRTVYAGLQSVSVQEKEEVSAGKPLGLSGRSIDGEYVHFEIWHGREKVNPVRWLIK